DPAGTPTATVRDRRRTLGPADRGRRGGRPRRRVARRPGRGGRRGPGGRGRAGVGPEPSDPNDRRDESDRDPRSGRSAHPRLLGRHLLGDRARPDLGPDRGHDLARRRQRRGLHLARVPALRRRTGPDPHLRPLKPVLDRAGGAELGVRQPGLLQRRPRPDHRRGQPRPDPGDQGPDRRQHHARRRDPAAGVGAGTGRPGRVAPDDPHRQRPAGAGRGRAVAAPRRRADPLLHRRRHADPGPRRQGQSGDQAAPRAGADPRHRPRRRVVLLRRRRGAAGPGGAAGRDLLRHPPDQRPGTDVRPADHPLQIPQPRHEPAGRDRARHQPPGGGDAAAGSGQPGPRQRRRPGAVSDRGRRLHLPRRGDGRPPGHPAPGQHPDPDRGRGTRTGAGAAAGPMGGAAGAPAAGGRVPL
ncbi:MAG: Amidohydrolase, partial [uncultured Thermomicrobiales bacterium]